MLKLNNAMENTVYGLAEIYWTEFKDSQLDQEWSGTAYQDERSPKFTWNEFHEAIQTQLTIIANRATKKSNAIADFQEHGKGFMCRVNGILHYTNKNGEGLWSGNGINDHQIMGTCQFSVSGIKPQSMKAKLKRFLNQ